MAGIFPGDLEGLTIRTLGKVSAVDMTTAAVFNVFANGPSRCMVTHIVMTNFSAFPTNFGLPATWAFTMGVGDSTAAAPAAPTNLDASTTISAQKAPFILAQSVANTSAIVPPFFTLYFAVATTTNGVGTFDLTILGGVMAK